MKLPGPPMPQRHLQPGELLVTQEPMWVVTLLGSCVSVTMFNARFQLAAICHAMLPEPRGDKACAHPSHCFRYLSHAIPAMCEHFFREGLAPDQVEVKMFGGSNVIQIGGDRHSNRWIGASNLALARQLLQSARLRIKAQNVGGETGSKICFNTVTGDVLHKHLSRSALGQTR